MPGWLASLNEQGVNEVTEYLLSLSGNNDATSPCSGILASNVCKQLTFIAKNRNRRGSSRRLQTN